ncbi:MAG TPA: AbrB/MazE/SpoVT family DNA-binding domain-containing protein [Opitutaceae bacterium]|nr:AbrB/MazE/SpoVT family DNA-binding domain-containing protein [Opitutaceae bacterium]
MNVTSKGQVTIPLRIRNRFGLKPGTAVEFVVERNKVVIRPKRRSKSSLDSWLEEATGFLRGSSTDERMRLTRGEVA